MKSNEEKQQAQTAEENAILVRQDIKVFNNLARCFIVVRKAHIRFIVFNTIFILLFNKVFPIIEETLLNQDLSLISQGINLLYLLSMLYSMTFFHNSLLYYFLTPKERKRLFITLQSNYWLSDEIKDFVSQLDNISLFKFFFSFSKLCKKYQVRPFDC